MWDASYLGCVMYLSLLQDLPGNGGPGPCCPHRGTGHWLEAWGLSLLLLVFLPSRPWQDSKRDGTWSLCQNLFGSC